MGHRFFIIFVQSFQLSTSSIFTFSDLLDFELRKILMYL